MGTMIATPLKIPLPKYLSFYTAAACQLFFLGIEFLEGGVFTRFEIKLNDLSMETVGRPNKIDLAVLNTLNLESRV
jgi:hypothetical protein